MDSKIISKMHHTSAKDVLKSLGIASLNEMAISIKDYKRKVDGLRFQLVENWCLCMWCHMFNEECENFIHWADELSAYINALKMVNLKSGDKKKILTKMLVDDYDYDDPLMVFDIIRDKFTVENIVDTEQLKAVAKSFSVNVGSLVENISNRSIPTLAYIKETFIENNKNA